MKIQALRCSRKEWGTCRCWHIRLIPEKSQPVLFDRVQNLSLLRLQDTKEVDTLQPWSSHISSSLFLSHGMFPKYLLHFFFFPLKPETRTIIWWDKSSNSHFTLWTFHEVPNYLLWKLLASWSWQRYSVWICVREMTLFRYFKSIYDIDVYLMLMC